MLMKKIILFYAITSLLGLVVIWAGSNKKSKNILESTTSSTPIETTSKAPGQASNDRKLSPTPITPITADNFYRNLKTAECQIGGLIKFTSLTNAEHLNADLTYKGIDSPARLIKWNVSPVDDLKIGPNLAASLKLPDGLVHIGVVLPEKPIASRYTLTASITYGRLIDHDIKLFEMLCQGQVDVVLSF